MLKKNNTLTVLKSRILCIIYTWRTRTNVIHGLDSNVILGELSQMWNKLLCGVVSGVDRWLLAKRRVSYDIIGNDSISFQFSWRVPLHE